MITKEQRGTTASDVPGLTFLTGVSVNGIPIPNVRSIAVIGVHDDLTEVTVTFLATDININAD